MNVTSLADTGRCCHGAVGSHRSGGSFFQLPGGIRSARQTGRHLSPPIDNFLEPHDDSSPSPPIPMVLLKKLAVASATGTRTWTPADSRNAASPNAVPTHSVCTGGLMYFIVSYMAKASDSYPSLSPPFCSTAHKDRYQ
jgi:hypothetical protein